MTKQKMTNQKMTNQEEIREGIEIILFDNSIKGRQHQKDFTELAKDIMRMESDKGAELRAKCPSCEWYHFQDEESVGMTPCYRCNSTGYIYEPLIGK